MKKVVALIMLVLLLTSCKKDIYRKLIKVEKEPVNLAILNVDIFDGKNSELLKSKDVFIEKGIIQSIQPAGEQSAENYYRVDGQGKVLMPGFVDAHVHTGSNGEVPWERVKTDVEHTLHAYLYAGITTVYDLGGFGKKSRKLSEKQQKGKLIAPEVYFTHSPVTIPGGHPIPVMEEMAPWPVNKMIGKAIVQIKEEEDAEKIVRKYKNMKVDFFKVILEDLPPGTPVMSDNLLKALIDEAHKQDLKVFVHIGTPEQAIKAIDAGADVLAHGIYRERMTDAQAQKIAQANIPMIYTISAFENVYHIGLGEYQPTEMDREISPAELLDAVSGEQGKKFKEYESMKGFHAGVAKGRENWAHNIQLLHKKGARIIVGTDSPLPGSYPGSSLHQEMQMLHTFGIPNIEILKGATSYSAALFLETPDFGTVEEGKKANLILLGGNPVDNLKAAGDIEKVIINGKVVEKVLPEEN